MSIGTKEEIFKAWEKTQLEGLEQQYKLQTYEAKLDKTVQDATYWLDTYTKAFAVHDKNLNGIQETINGRLDVVLEQL